MCMHEPMVVAILSFFNPRCCGVISRTVYEAQWVGSGTFFSEIVVNRSMWVHHRTENIAAALNAMNKQANIQ